MLQQMSALKFQEAFEEHDALLEQNRKSCMECSAEGVFFYKTKKMAMAAEAFEASAAWALRTRCCLVAE